MLAILLIFIFTLHFLLVSIPTIAPFICIALEWKESASGDKLAGLIGRDLIKKSLFALVIGIALGFLTLWILCLIYPRPYMEAILRIPSRGVWLGLPERIWSTFAELLIYAVTMLLYLWTWNLWREKQGALRFCGRFINRGLGLFSGTNILYHLPVLFAVIAVVGTHPEKWEQPTSFIKLLMLPEVLARTFHTWLASTIVCGVFLMTYVFRSLKLEVVNTEEFADQEEVQQEEVYKHDADRPVIWGARIAACATLLQLLSGVYLLFNISAAPRDLMMGGNIFITGLFGVSLLATLGLLHLLSALAFGDVERKNVFLTFAVTLFLLVMMLSVRHLARDSIMQQLPDFYVNGKVTAGE